MLFLSGWNLRSKCIDLLAIGFQTGYKPYWQRYFIFFILLLFAITEAPVHMNFS